MKKCNNISKAIVFKVYSYFLSFRLITIIFETRFLPKLNFRNLYLSDLSLARLGQANDKLLTITRMQILMIYSGAIHLQWPSSDTATFCTTGRWNGFWKRSFAQRRLTQANKLYNYIGFHFISEIINVFHHCKKLPKIFLIL